MVASRTLELGLWTALACASVFSCGGSRHGDVGSTTTPENSAPSSESSAASAASNDSASTDDSSESITRDGDASSRMGDDDWVRILTERAGGVARGPANIPLAEATSLASACEQAGKTFIDGQGVCLAQTLSDDVQLVGPSQDLTTCPDEPAIGGVSLSPTADVEFASMSVEGVALEYNDRALLYDVAVTIDQTQCFGRLNFHLAWRDALPHFQVGESFRFRKYVPPAGSPSYAEIRSVDDDLLWLSFSGEFARYQEYGPPDVELELIPDDNPTCYTRGGDEVYLSHGVTFRTPNGECHLEPASANCCTLWGEPYFVQLDRFLKDGYVNYLIAKADFLASAEEIRSAE